MNITDALNELIAGRNLSQHQTKAIFDLIMGGEATPAQISAVLVGLRAKGESSAEIAGAAMAMRDAALKVDVDVPNLVDTAGTGGSGTHKLFNVSTAAGVVAAAAGAYVAKHGNRAASSTSGSADVLELAGISLELTPEQIARCITEVGIGFLFAQAHHSAMRFAGPVRAELGVKTVFNLLGPLTNPAGAKRQVIGVFDPVWQRPMAEVAQTLGAEHVLVVHSQGLDEISAAGETRVVELRDDQITQYSIEPADFGLENQDVSELQANSPEASLKLIEEAFGGANPAAINVVALNGGAAIYASGVATSLANGVLMAEDVIMTGQAKEKFADLKRMSSSLVDQ